MALPSLDGQPATQVIPVQGPPASQALPSALLALEIPVVTGVPSQTIPVVSRGVGIAPWDVEGMRSVWDAYDSAVYNGSSQLVSITDKGPDANNMVADVAGMPAGTYNVNGTPTTLPGPPTAANQVLETNLSETIDDFTVFLLIPNRGTHSTQRCHFAIRNTSSSFSLLVEASGTLGSLAIKSATATDATINVGFGTAGAASGAHAILGLRKKGTTLIVDVWYDALDGNGLQGPVRSYHTTTIGSVSAAGMSFGGRGGFALTQWWDTDPLHLAAWADIAVTDYTMEAMAEWAGARLGFAVPAAVESAEPLAAKYTGGQELHDGTGHLPRDADGYYLSRTTGERLLIDAGYAELDSVGAPKVYGLLTAVVVGAPATARRSGLDNLSATDFVAITLASDVAHTFLGRATMTSTPTASTTALFGVDASGYRWGLTVPSANAVETRLFDNATLRATATATSVGAHGSGAEYWAGGTATSAGDVTVETLDASGASVLASASGSYAPGAPGLGGTYYIGRDRGGGGTFAAGTMDVLLGWDGSEVGAATRQAIAAAYHAGATVDHLRTAYGAQLVTDGIICGAYDPANPTELYTLSGTGTPVVVARPATSLAALHPTVAVYQGGQELHDGTGHLPRLGTGAYLSRTGVLLSIDDGYAVGATVGPPKIVDLIAGSVVGTLSTLRRAAIQQTSDTDYGIAAVTGASIAVCFECDMSDTNRLLFDSFVNTNRVFFGTGTGSRLPRLYLADTGVTGDLTGPGVGPAVGTPVIMAGGYNGATGRMWVGMWLSATGELVGYDSKVVAAGLDFTGPAYVGRRLAAGAAWGVREIRLGLVWDGTTFDSQAAIEAVVADIVAGVPADELQTLHGSDVAADGLVCGAYDSTAPTILYTPSGAGAPVVVAAA